MTSNYIYLKVPVEAWDVLAETLSMDMDSNHIDRELREEIAKAFTDVEILKLGNFCLKVEAQSEDEQYERLYLMIYAPDGHSSGLLRESISTLDEMTEEEFDAFIQYAREQSVNWMIDLDIQVDKEYYFKGD